MTNIQQSLEMETNQSLLHIKSDNDVRDNLRASMNTIIQLILELDGDFTLQPDQQLRHHQRTGSSTTIGSRIKVGILGVLQSGQNSTFSFFSYSGGRFRLPEFSIPWHSTEGIDRYTCHFNTYSHCTQLARIAQSHSSHATRVAQDKDCVPDENTSPSCASCLMP